MWTISEPVPCSSSHSTVSLCSRSPTTSSKLKIIVKTLLLDYNDYLLMFSSFMVTRSSSVRSFSCSRELHTQVWSTWQSQ